MITSPSSLSQYNNNICQFVLSIQQNELKCLRKMMKTKLARNLKLVRSGILIAFQHNNCEALKILISSPLPDLFEDDINLLHCVVLTSKVDFLRILLSDIRVDINRVVGDADGRTPLMVACTSGKVEMVEELLSYPKVDVNAQDEIREWSALCYALHMGTSDMVQMILNHKDTSESNIQESLLVGMLSVSVGHHPLDLELLDFLVKKNFENEFSLKVLSNGRSEFHEHFQSWIAEEIEMKIREEYYKGNIDVTEESFCNKAFGFSYDVLQASLIKCRCFQCNTVKTIKQTMYMHGVHNLSDKLKFLKSKAKINKSNVLKNTTEGKCLLKAKLHFEKRTVDVMSDFITSPLPSIFKHIVINGGHERDLDAVFNGTKSVGDISRETKRKETKILLSKDINENIYNHEEKDKNIHNNIHNNDKRIENISENFGNIEDISESTDNNEKKNKVITEKASNDDKKKEDTTENTENNNNEVIDFSSLCWSCSSTLVKLYKCSGCRRARYCGVRCIEDDWEQHGGYCVKVQQRRKNSKSTSQDTILS